MLSCMVPSRMSLCDAAFSTRYDAGFFPLLNASSCNVGRNLTPMQKREAMHTIYNKNKEVPAK